MKITDLDFRYDSNDEKYIFKDFSMDLPKKNYLLTGDSGSGKTTLLKLIAGLIVPEKGIIEGAPSRPAVMFQEDRLLPWINVRKNIELAGGDTAKAEKLLERLGIDGDLTIQELSGGMSRRVAFIRAICFDSDALLLDEPFNGMDSSLIDRCIEIIREEDKFTIISTHQPNVQEKIGFEKIIL